MGHKPGQREARSMQGVPCPQESPCQAGFATPCVCEREQALGVPRQCRPDPCAESSPGSTATALQQAQGLLWCFITPLGEAIWRHSPCCFSKAMHCLDAWTSSCPGHPFPVGLHAAEGARVDGRLHAEVVRCQEPAVPGQSGQVGCGQPATFSTPVQPGRGPRQARREGCRNLIKGVEGGDVELAPGCPRGAVVAAGIPGSTAARGC